MTPEEMKEIKAVLDVVYTQGVAAAQALFPIHSVISALLLAATIEAREAKVSHADFSAAFMQILDVSGIPKDEN